MTFLCMKKIFNKGETVIATNLSTNERFTFTCTKDGSCEKMLRRYVCMHLGKGTYLDKFLFLKK